MRPSSRKAAATLAVLVFSGLAATPASADQRQDVDNVSTSDITAFTEPTGMDIATANISQVADQLNALNQRVNTTTTTQARLLAEQTQTEENVETLADQIDATETEIVNLERELAQKAVLSFQRNAPTSSLLLAVTNPRDAIRKRKLSSSVTKSAIEVAAELRQAKANLASQEATQDSLEKERARETREYEANLEKFSSARQAVMTVAQEAEQRAERMLAEADMLGETDQEQAEALREQVRELNEQIRLALNSEVEEAEKRAKADPTSVEVPTEPATLDDMREVQGIWVHKDIAANVDAMIDAARSDGIELSGGGFRDPASQIAVRKSNCGTSNYAIYQMPASSCRPPTARPGQSMHERGKAIDIKYNGSTISSRSSPGFVWLSANAKTYGLLNLPSEPWHWSVNGR